MEPEPLLKVDVVSGVEGPSLYFDDHRVDGPKPWGGGHILHTFTVLVNDLDRVTVLSKALAEAREQGARGERERLRHIGPERLSATLAVMPAPYRVQSWSSGGTGDSEPPWDAPVHEVFPISALVDALLATLLAEPTDAP